MKKTVQSVKNSLKFKTQPKVGILSVRVGVRKYNLPVEGRMLSNGDYIFLSFPASSELYKITGKALEPMEGSADATEAFQTLNPGKRRGGRRRNASSVEMPAELQEALKTLPSGFKLGYSPDGEPKLVRTRTRQKRAKK